ncbi:hypothetical protein C8F04DRAFT_1131281 [Mycena alexandri]|uniref:Uncharacterized protein n=1 Tax=Mycena alexandri TaxID=1745969 RepID=A0AAD6SD74_9AGAR|nr:hypothetical protein C8F04DRAFT_1131281 [Mycena alexandri]
MAGKLPLYLPRFHSRWATLCSCGVVALLLLWFIIPRHERAFIFPPMILDSVAQQLGHPTFPDIRFYERALPQHVAPSAFSKGTERPRYLFFPQASWGSGWNNVFQGALLNTHLAYLAKRAYVFPGYIPRDHPPFPDSLNGTRHWLHIPMNAFVSGPTGGGPLSADGESDSHGLMRRAVSEEWWNVVCPRKDVVVVKMYDAMRQMRLDDTSDGEEMLSKWANKLLKMSAPCVSVEGGPPFDYLFIGSRRVISLWPSYGGSPTLKYFAWSPLITATLLHNFQLFSPHGAPDFLTPIGSRPYRFQSYPRYRPSSRPFTGLLGIHVRRGDYDGHCINLANGGADFNAWNLLGTPGITRRPSRPGFQSSTPPGYVWPALPDYLDVPAGKSRHDAAFDHCWPSPEAIAARVHEVREAAASGVAYPHQDLRKVYIASNGDMNFIGPLAALLRADGWDVSSSLDMELTLEGHAVSQAVDMAVLTGAESFIGVGFSSVTSNVVQIRLAAGRAPQTIHFW